MSLPFLKPKKVAGLIIAKRQPDGSKQEMHEDGDGDHALIACAEDLIRAIHAKDAQSVADAFRAAFEVLESEPHDEAPHSYDEMNAQAAKEQE